MSCWACASGSGGPWRGQSTERRRPLVRVATVWPGSAWLVGQHRVWPVSLPVHCPAAQRVQAREPGAVEKVCGAVASGRDAASVTGLPRPHPGPAPPPRLPATAPLEPPLASAHVDGAPGAGGGHRRRQPRAKGAGGAGVGPHHLGGRAVVAGGACSWVWEGQRGWRPNDEVFSEPHPAAGRTSVLAGRPAPGPSPRPTWLAGALAGAVLEGALGALAAEGLLQVGEEAGAALPGLDRCRGALVAGGAGLAGALPGLVLQRARAGRAARARANSGPPQKPAWRLTQLLATSSQLHASLNAGHPAHAPGTCRRGRA